ncbi:hypothetical protein PSE10C_43290 [Pseudomonas amygdali pv. eriobotryae]|nr:hypothetical protein PSE10C_43290 [Pseudomonas amygdali pv. eriobotryae]
MRGSKRPANADKHAEMVGSKKRVPRLLHPMLSWHRVRTERSHSLHDVSSNHWRVPNVPPALWIGLWKEILRLMRLIDSGTPLDIICPNGLNAPITSVA